MTITTSSPTHDAARAAGLEGVPEMEHGEICDMHMQRGDARNATRFSEAVLSFFYLGSPAKCAFLGPFLIMG